MPLRECPPLVNVLIQALDLRLTKHIKNSSSFNPLIICAIQGLEKGNPLSPRSALLDWKFEDEHLYYKDQMYVSPNICQSLVSSLHESPTLGHAGCFYTKTFVEHNFWWSGLSTFINNFVTRCTTCQQNKVNTHPTIPLLNSILSKLCYPSNKSPLTSSPTSQNPTNMIL